MVIKSVFDWVKVITTTKPHSSSFSEGDWELWNSYTIHRALSMNPNNLEIVNLAQSILPQNKREIYAIYKEFIPKTNSWSKWLKSKNKKPNSELIDHLKSTFSLSSREVIEYLSLLKKDTLVEILENRGVEPKDIKKLLK